MDERRNLQVSKGVIRTQLRCRVLIFLLLRQIWNYPNSWTPDWLLIEICPCWFEISAVCWRRTDVSYECVSATSSGGLMKFGQLFITSLPLFINTFLAFLPAVPSLNLLSFSAGNSKQALRCKTCKIAAHLWCTSELSQQPCHGKVQTSLCCYIVPSFVSISCQKIIFVTLGGRPCVSAPRWSEWFHMDSLGSYSSVSLK